MKKKAWWRQLVWFWQSRCSRVKFRQQTGRQLSRQVPPNSDVTDGICSYACHAARSAVLVQTTQFKRSHKNVTRTQKELHTEQNAIVGRKPLTLICRLRTLKPAECYSLASRGSAISANPDEDTSSKTCSPLRTDSTFSMRLVNSRPIDRKKPRSKNLQPNDSDCKFCQFII